MNSYEHRKGLIGYEEALQLTLTSVGRMPEELCSPTQALGRVAASDVLATINLPSVDSSMKDGYAVKSSDLEEATTSRAVYLELIGSSVAGRESDLEVSTGTAVRILCGAPTPKGADAILAEEFAELQSGMIRVIADAHVGRNILKAGADIMTGQALVCAGELITPAKVGLLVAGGVSRLSVARKPSIGLLATGDEVILPGQPLTEGKLYASNIALQDAWLRSLGLKCSSGICGDSLDQLIQAIDRMSIEHDILMTSGGVWTGERDLVIRALESLDWRPVFHRCRMGPGKAVGMGMLRGKPVFCLPGGPPSNEMAFLMIALPAIARMLGRKNGLIPQFFGSMTQDIHGQKEWTQFVHCDLKHANQQFQLTPRDFSRRLSAMSFAKAIVKIPEGVTRIVKGTTVPFYSIDMVSE